MEGVLHGVSPSHAPFLPLSFLATERLADRTHLPQLGNYHRGGDDDILLHLLHPLLQKNLQRGDAAEGYRQQCAHSDAFSFAYVLLVTFVDDHFGMSLFFLSMTLYLAGKQQQEHRSMPWWQTALLFFFTAGITLSNGAKTFLAALFTNGKKLFRPKYLALGVILPTLLIGAAGIYQNKAFIIPNRLEGERLVAQKAAKDSTFRAKMEQKQKHDKAIAGKNIQKRGMLSWADMSISRSESLVENVFGESLILHREHLLEDIHSHRPIFVKYQTPVPYIIEGIIVILLCMGFWMGRRSAFLWLTASWVACDAFIHLVMGFGLNEVYIMAAHWAFIIPICIGYIIRNCKEKYLPYLRGGLAIITIFLFFYNSTLIFQYLTR